MPLLFSPESTVRLAVQRFKGAICPYVPDPKNHSQAQLSHHGSRHGGRLDYDIKCRRCVHERFVGNVSTVGSRSIAAHAKGCMDPTILPDATVLWVLHDD